MSQVDLAAIERAYGLPPGYLHRTKMLESGGRLDARNPNSSATGPFQFIDSTARQYGLTDRTDLAASADAAARLARDNAAQLRRALGREPTAAELYLAHQQGAGGAVAMLSNPDAQASGLVGDAAVRLNAGQPGQTGGAFAQHWLDKFNQGYQGDRMTPQAAQEGILPLSMGQAEPSPQDGILASLMQAYKDTIGQEQPMQAPQMMPRQASGYTPQRRDTVAPLLQFFQSMRG
jgi:hypothetical protein